MGDMQDVQKMSTLASVPLSIPPTPNILPRKTTESVHVRLVAFHSLGRLLFHAWIPEDFSSSSSSSYSSSSPSPSSRNPLGGGPNKKQRVSSAECPAANSSSPKRDEGADYDEEEDIGDVLQRQLEQCQQRPRPPSTAHQDVDPYVESLGGVLYPSSSSTAPKGQMQRLSQQSTAAVGSSSGKACSVSAAAEQAVLRLSLILHERARQFDSRVCAAARRIAEGLRVRRHRARHLLARSAILLVDHGLANGSLDALRDNFPIEIMIQTPAAASPARWEEEEDEDERRQQKVCERGNSQEDYREYFPVAMPGSSEKAGESGQQQPRNSGEGSGGRHCRLTEANPGNGGVAMTRTSASKMFPGYGKPERHGYDDDYDDDDGGGGGGSIIVGVTGGSKYLENGAAHTDGGVTFVGPQSRSVMSGGSGDRTGENVYGDDRGIFGDVVATVHEGGRRQGRAAAMGKDSRQYAAAIHFLVEVYISTHI